MRSFVRITLAVAGLAAAAPIAAQTEATADAQQRYAKAQTAYGANDFATAAPLLIGLCEEGYSQTCAAAGVLAANGQGMDQDIAKALALFDRGCIGKRAESCRSAADIYEQAAPPIRDASQAARYELKACDLGHMRSCQKLGHRYTTGVGAEKDRETAFYLANKACTGNDGEGCADLGRLYLPYPKNPESGPQYDPAKAAEYYSKACDLKSGRGCALLADKHETGVGVEKDPAKALELYRLALTYNPEQWVRNSVEGQIRRLEQAEAAAAPSQ